MSKIISFIKNLSLLGAALVICLAYFDLSKNEKIHLYFNYYDVSQVSISKEIFFYTPVFFVALLNILLIVLVKTIKQTPIRLLPMAYKEFWSQNEETQFHCREMFMSWLLSLGFWINIFVIFFLIRIWKINRAMKGMEDAYTSLFYGGIIVLTTWLVLFIVRLQLKKHEIIE